MHPDVVQRNLEPLAREFDEDEIPRIFDRFYRGRAARATAVKGTGLGLSIAETVVKAHEGRIVVESSPGAGSTVTILLPVRSS